MKKNNIIVSALFTLSPILIGLILWNKLPDTIGSIFAISKTGSFFTTKIVTVFIVPIILCVFDIICLIITSKDNKMKNQNKKIVKIILWIIPMLSIFTSSMIYSIMLGWEFGTMYFIPIITGLTYIILGNYMPKCKQNFVMGIRTSWTLNNEENWNLTHRFAGKIWVITGLIVLLSIVFPVNYMFIVFTIAIVISVVVPVICSYNIYKKHKKAGLVYIDTRREASKKEKKITIIILVVTFAFVGIILFTGNIKYTFEKDVLNIEVSYWSDAAIKYEDIESVVLQENVKSGVRTNGLGSYRLLAGDFSNEEYGNYLRYTYTNSSKVIVMKVKGKTVVIGCENESKTEELYKQIKSKI